jgi:hypothetical protein
MTISIQVLLFIIATAGGLLSWALTKTYAVAVELTKVRGEIAQAKLDAEEEKQSALNQRNNIGEKVRQVESKLWYLAWMTCPEDKRQEVLNAMVRRLN